MATPRTGAGAYTAMVDAHMLGKFFKEHLPKHGIDKVLEAYNADGVKRAKNLY